jgi:hypothetical protein
VSLVNPLNAELNPICHLLALLGAYHFLHFSRIRVKQNGEEKSTYIDIAISINHIMLCLLIALMTLCTQHTTSGLSFPLPNRNSILKNAVITTNELNKGCKGKM